MAKRDLGKAQYKAIRNGALVRLIARGTIPYFNIKVDFEQLPILIAPPQFGFFFIAPEVMYGGPLPFVHEESFPYSTHADHIIILDADGRHLIEIDEVSIDPVPFTLPPPDQAGWCVFTNVGTGEHMIGRCDAPVLAIYAKSFGPATYQECTDYIANNAPK